jgi:hypothetical protein
MRSPRNRFETACRVGSFALLGWLIGSTIIPRSGARVERVSAPDIAARLTDWTRTATPLIVHAELPAVPAPWIVSWMAALRHSGKSVRWTGEPPAVAISAQAAPDPVGGVRIDVAAPTAAFVRLADDASTLDTVRVSGVGASVASPIAVGAIRAEVGDQRAASRVLDSARVRAVLIVGGASWEGKFIAAALEERGWPVLARYSVAPNVEVTQGTALAIDTSRIAVVIAIDSTVQSLGTPLERFVRAGGGLILAGSAGRAPLARVLAPGAVGERTRPRVTRRDTIRLGTTGFYPVANLREEGVVLERRAGAIAVAARRYGAGRVIQAGYDDTWRWRLAGEPGAETAHREWWSRVVASAAYVPLAAAGGAPGYDSAPLAGLVEALGAPRAGAAGVPHAPLDRRIFMVLIMLLLLAEWTSRRLRGLR